MCGVGGRTIAEAQQRISYPEFVRWARYRAKRGTLNAGLRQERGSALLAAMYANAHRGKDTAPFSWQDFAPYHDQPEITLDQAMKTWG